MISIPPSRLIPWKVCETSFVLDNPWAKVRRDWCELADGVTVPDYYYWEGGDFVQVLAATAEGNVLLTRQYKHGVKEVVLELPAGLIDARDATPLEAAKRELREETGYGGGSWAFLGRLNVSSAKATTQAYSFAAKNVQHIGVQELDRNERIEVLTVDSDEIPGLIANGSIRDTSSIATAYLALLRPEIAWKDESVRR